jgi:hypothetical protein
MARTARVGIWLVLVTVGLGNLAAAEKPAAMAEWFPPGAFLTAEISSAKPVLDLLLADNTLQAVSAVPELQKAMARPDFRQFRAVVGFLEATLGADWKTATRKLVGGAVLAVYPQNGVLLIVEAPDAEMLKRLHDTVIQFAKGDAEKAGQPNRVASKEYQGVTVWTLGNDEAHAIVGNRLVLANRPAILKSALDQRTQPAGKSLAASSQYQAARQAAKPGSVGFVVLDMAMLKLNPGIKNGLAESNTNPMVRLLFAGLTEALQESTWLAVSLGIKDDTFALTATTDGKPSEMSTFAFPTKSSAGALANLSVPRTIAAFSLYRDLHAFYAQKDKLFPDRTSGLIFFENMMGIFFTGRDLTDEVFAEMKPETRFVVAQQQYDPKFGTPRVQVPAFAAVFRVHRPEQFRDVAEEAWQKALGLINFTRGQKAQPGLIIDRPTHNQTQFTVARFPTPSEKEKAEGDLRFNFRPSLAMLGDYLVFSSTEQLARELMDALEKEMSKPVQSLAGTSSLVELDGTQLASILAANRENFVRQNMVEKGQSQEEAEHGVGLMLTLVKLLGRAKLDIGAHEGLTQASLELQLKLK